MKLSAIVPAYNEEKTIGGCLDSLLDQTRPFDETVVVDNASTDRTAEVVADYATRSPTVRIVAEPAPGIFHARRAGFDAATGDVLARTDATRGCRETGLRRSKLISPTLRARNSRCCPVRGGLFGDGPPFDPLRMLVERSRLFREGGEGAGVIGPNMIMSARAWRDIRDDLIDDDAIYEDVDVSHRLAAHGYKAWFSPQVAVEQSPRQLRHSPWQNRRYLVGGYRLARARHDRKLAALFVLEMPFRFALYTVYWLTFRPWDPRFTNLASPPALHASGERASVDQRRA